MNATVLQFNFPKTFNAPESTIHEFIDEFKKWQVSLAQALPTPFVGNVLQSPDGTYWQVTVDNAGVLTGTNLGALPPKV